MIPKESWLIPVTVFEGGENGRGAHQMMAVLGTCTEVGSRGDKTILRFNHHGTETEGEVSKEFLPSLKQLELRIQKDENEGGLV